MPGTKTNSNSVKTTIDGYSVAAITAAQILKHWVAPFAGRILAVMARTETAGAGAGTDVVDVLINGVTAYTTAGNKPTLLCASIGQFSNTNPDVRSFQAGDLLSIVVASVGAGGGHQQVYATVAIGLA